MNYRYVRGPYSSECKWEIWDGDPENIDSVVVACTENEGVAREICRNALRLEEMKIENDDLRNQLAATYGQLCEALDRVERAKVFSRKALAVLDTLHGK